MISETNWVDVTAQTPPPQVAGLHVLSRRRGQTSFGASLSISNCINLHTLHQFTQLFSQSTVHQEPFLPDEPDEATSAQGPAQGFFLVKARFSCSPGGQGGCEVVQTDPGTRDKSISWILIPGGAAFPRRFLDDLPSCLAFSQPGASGGAHLFRSISFPRKQWPPSSVFCHAGLFPPFRGHFL